MGIRKLLAAALLVLALPARADFYIVVHASNPQRSLTQKEAVDLFMGRSHAFANGEFALIFDLPRDNPHRAAFYQALPDEAAMAGLLRRNPSALGWLSKEPAEPGLRTVLVVKEPAR
jgi:hypothetical protein